MGLPFESDASARLTERVRARVQTAASAMDRRQGTARRDRAALRVVFTELGASYRDFRRRTGTEPSPRVREAAEAFKHAPSLASLVAVAGQLVDIGVLS